MSCFHCNGTGIMEGGRMCSYMDGAEDEKKARGESYCTDLVEALEALKR